MKTPQIESTESLLSPSLVVVRETLESNLTEMIRIAGNVDRLRPHCKTHKMAAVTKIELQRGITRHKCATFAEAEMLAAAGVKDIFLAYNIVGANLQRVVEFRRRFPDVDFSVTADDQRMISALGEIVSSQPAATASPLGVLLDLDSGLKRTGVHDPERAAVLYQHILQTAGLRAAGFHLYDGQNHQTPLDERTAAVMAGWEFARSLRDQFVARGWPVERIVCGGTGSFPIFARLTDPAVELSPGTCVFHDNGYGRAFPDMNFHPALWVFTRVISRPTSDRLTLDVGNKAVASDPPKGSRIVFPELPDAEQVLHNEEHLVLVTPLAEKYRPGDVLWGIPQHVCPTTALHKWAYVAEGNRIVDRWEVTSRDRQLTI